MKLAKFLLVTYLDKESVIPLCIILPQMSGWVKYFEIVEKI